MTTDAQIEQRSRENHRDYVNLLTAIVATQRDLIEAVEGTEYNDPIHTSGALALEIKSAIEAKGDDTSLNRESLAFLLAAALDEIARGNNFHIPADSEEVEQ